jgi:hypothetical protein
MRLNRQGFLPRFLQWCALGIVVMSTFAAMSGCGGTHDAKTGTLAPPVQDDYGKTMEEWMKTHPPKK